MSLRKIDDGDTMHILNLLFSSEDSHIRVLKKHQINSFNKFLDVYLPKLLLKKEKFSIGIASPTSSEGYNKFDIIVKFSNVTYTPPMYKSYVGEERVSNIFPNEARRMNLDYELNIYVDIKLTIKAYIGDTMRKVFKTSIDNHPLTRMPAMVCSRMCSLAPYPLEEYHRFFEDRYDGGGYFIIKGQEKVVVSSERVVQNTVFYENITGKSHRKNNHLCHVKSRLDDKFDIIFKFQIAFSPITRQITFVFPLVSYNKPMPISLLLTSLGLVTDESIISYVIRKNLSLIDNVSDLDIDMFRLLEPSLNKQIIVNGEHVMITSKINALDILGDFILPAMERMVLDNIEDKRTRTQDYIDKKVLPHLGTSVSKKAFYICSIMIRKLLLGILGRTIKHDKNSFVIKRVDTAGPLFAQLFKQYKDNMFKTIINKSRELLTKQSFSTIENLGQEAIVNILGVKHGDSPFNLPVKNGDWGIGQQQTKKAKSGITQTLERESYLMALSGTRRVNATISAKQYGLATNIRELHSTQLGMICILETPESEKIGLLKNLALSVEITTGQAKEPLETIVKSQEEFISIESYVNYFINDRTIIFINGAIIGLTEKAKMLTKKLINLRREGIIPYDISISYKTGENELQIWRDDGRMIRPLLIVDPGNKLRITQDIIDKIKKREITWTEIISGNQCCIEYLSVEEIIESCVLAQYPSEVYAMNSNVKRFTHCEIHPSMIFGVSGGVIPFANHNPGIRGLYQSSMNKQAIGQTSTTMNYRTDAIALMLQFPQIRISTTLTCELIDYNKLSPGQNAMLLIACYTGFNQEDSLIVNQTSIERGLLNTYTYKTINIEILEGKNKCVKYPDFEKIQEIEEKWYSHLDKETGIIKVGSVINKRDVLVSMIGVEEIPNSSKTRMVDKSVAWVENFEAVVDSIIVGNSFIKIKIRVFRRPKTGDKFCSSSAQKGTISVVLPQWYMPLTKDGVSPDIIMNPHGFSTRMTLGMIIEMISSIVGAKCMVFVDATTFNNTDIHALWKRMKKLGYDRAGKQVFYNGFTGEQIVTQLFMAPSFYYRLKHMVDDKVHGRGRGPNVGLTRQPVGGRAKEGGLKVGTMEVNAIAAHGGNDFIRDRLMDASDGTEMYICDNCGMVAVHNDELGIYKCTACPTSHVSKVYIPYCTNILQQYEAGMGIRMKLSTKSSN